MAGRPASRDEDAMKQLLTGLKARVAKLEARTIYPVGRSWRIQEAGNRDLIAVQPGKTTVTLASPGGPCGTVLGCVEDALGGTLDLDSRRRLGVRISGDAGNRLGVGRDHGLFSAGVSGGPGFAEFGTAELPAPPGTPVDFDDWTERGGAFIKPEGEYGDPFRDTAGVLLPLTTGAAQPKWDTVNCAPGTNASVKLPAHTSSGTTAGLMGLAWHLRPWSRDHAVTPDWVGDWLEAEATFVFSDTPTDPYRCALIRFFPGATVFLRSDGRITAVPNGGHGGYYTGTPPVMPKEIVSRGYIAYNTPVRIRLRLSRSGQSSVKIYYTANLERGDDRIFDDWITFGPHHINFDEFNWGGYSGPRWPWFRFGTNLEPEFYDPPAAKPYPPVSMPDTWMSNVRLRISLPEPVYFKTQDGRWPSM